MIAELAASIAEDGVRHVFGIPGGGASLELIDALEKEGIVFHTTHFEGSAAMMAGASGRVRGRAGVALSIKGPGLANMVPGLALCKLESLPVVALAESYARSETTRAHKRMDHENLVRAVTKGSWFLSAKHAEYERLARYAEDEPPGPVLLNLAVDEHVTSIVGSSSHSTSDERIEDVVEKARRPVVIAGTLAVRRGWSSELNKLNVPVFSTAAAKGVVNERRPHAAGVFTGAGLELTTEKRVLPEADLVVGLGVRSNEAIEVRPFHCPAINLDPLGEEASSAFQWERVGDAVQVPRIIEILKGRSWGQELIQDSLAELSNQVRAGPFSVAHVFDALEQRFSDQTRMVLDTGLFCTIGEHVWRAPSPDHFIGAGQSRYMGAALPLALGAALEDQTKPTIVVLGDGGIGMFLAEAKIAVRHHLPIVVVLVSDGGFGSIRMRAVEKGLTQQPLRFGDDSWVPVLAGLGFQAARAKDLSSLAQILEWDTRRGPLFVEVPFDEDGYLSMTTGIRS